MKVTELLQEHPELNGEKSQLEQLIKTFKAPKVKNDKDFSHSLKQQIKEKIHEKKAENPKYLAFYLHNFRFYFTGFSVALGCFMILFVLGFFSFNKTPQLLHNPKTLSYKESEAFWALPKHQIKQFASTSLLATSLVSEGSKPDPLSLLETVDQTEIPALNTENVRFYIWEKQIPKLNGEYFIAKTNTGTTIALNWITKALHIPNVSLNKLAKSQVNAIQFTDNNKEYEFSLDLKNDTFWAEFIQNENTPDKIIKSESLSEREIKKQIKKQLSSFWLSLEYYWDPRFEKNEDESQKVDLFYPKIIDKKEVWNLETQQQEEMHITFDIASKKILSLYNFKFQSYDLSEYPISREKTQLLAEIETLGNIDTSKQGKKTAIPMKKWKLVYLQQEDFLIPGLMFEPKTTGNEGTLFISLY